MLEQTLPDLIIIGAKVSMLLFIFLSSCVSLNLIIPFIIFLKLKETIKLLGNHATKVNSSTTIHNNNFLNQVHDKRSDNYKYSYYDRVNKIIFIINYFACLLFL